MAARVGMDVVFDEDRMGRWLGSHATGVLAVLFAAPILVGGRLGVVGPLAAALAALVDLLECVLHLSQASPQLSVFRLEFGVFFSELLEFVHDQANVQTQLHNGKGA